MRWLPSSAFDKVPADDPSHWQVTIDRVSVLSGGWMNERSETKDPICGLAH
jgi:hypothetical protein